MRYHRHGPGTSDLLINNDAILVPPENPTVLSKAIKMAWYDAEFRKSISSNGQNYALPLKDEDRLLNDLLSISLDLWKSRKLIEGSISLKRILIDLQAER